MEPPTLGGWSSHEEAVLCHRLLDRKGRVEISRTRLLVREIHLIIGEMSRICPRSRGYAVTALDIAQKLEELQDRRREFEWFIQSPGILYDAEDNVITPGRSYLARISRGESRRRMLWRIRGEPNYHCLQELFLEAGLDNIDFRRVISIISSIEGRERRWLGLQ